MTKLTQHLGVLVQPPVANNTQARTTQQLTPHPFLLPKRLHARMVRKWTAEGTAWTLLASGKRVGCKERLTAATSQPETSASKVLLAYATLHHKRSSQCERKGQQWREGPIVIRWITLDSMHLWITNSPVQVSHPVQFVKATSRGWNIVSPHRPEMRPFPATLTWRCPRPQWPHRESHQR